MAEEKRKTISRKSSKYLVANCHRPSMCRVQNNKTHRQAHGVCKKAQQMYKLVGVH